MTKSGLNILIISVLLNASCTLDSDQAMDEAMFRITNQPGDQIDPVFSSAGKYLAYRTNENGVWDIRVKDLETGDDRMITSSNKDHNDLQWSPDDNYISFTVYTNGNPQVALFNMKASRTDTVTTSSQRASNAHWSPEGRYLVMDVHVDGKNIWTLQLENSEFTQLTALQGEEENFGYSFDGKWVGYASRGSAYTHLQAVNWETGEVKKLISDQDGFEWHPRWSKKSFEVVFYSTWNDEMTDIWLTDGTPEGLTGIANRDIEEFGPSLNYQEDMIAFFTWDNSNDIGVFKRSTKTIESLLLKQEMIVLWSPLSWSPKGNRLALVGMHQKDRLYSVSVENGKTSLLLPDESNAYETNPCLSADGRFLLYSDNKNVVIRDLHTGRVVSIPPEEDHQSDTYPTWVPNSNGQIAFIHGIGGASDTNDLWMMNQDGTNKRPITSIGGIKGYCWIDEDNFTFSYDSSTSYDNYDIWAYQISTGIARPILMDPDSDLYPSDVSPSTRTLLFTGNFSGSEKVYRMSLDGGTYTELETSTGGGRGAVFSPDGSQIAFLSNDNEESIYDVYICPASGGQAKRITHTRAEEKGLIWSEDGQQVIFSANLGDKDIYVVDVDRRLSEIEGKY